MEQGSHVASGSPTASQKELAKHHDIPHLHPTISQHLKEADQIQAAER